MRSDILVFDSIRAVNKRQRCEEVQADRAPNTKQLQWYSRGAMSGGVTRSSVRTSRGKKYELNQESEGFRGNSLTGTKECLERQFLGCPHASFLLICQATCESRACSCSKL